MDDNVELLIIFDEVGKGMDDNDELKTVDIVLVDERLVLVSFMRVVDIITLKVCAKLLMLMDDLSIIDGDEDGVITERGVPGMINICDSLIKDTTDEGVMMDDSNWENDETERGVVEIKDVIDDCDSKDVIIEGVSDLINGIDTTGEGVMMDDSNWENDETERGVVEIKDEIDDCDSKGVIIEGVSDLINDIDTTGEGVMMDDFDRDDGILKTERGVLELTNVSDKINEGIDGSKRDTEGDKLEIDVVEMINVFDFLIKDMSYDIT